MGKRPRKPDRKSNPILPEDILPEEFIYNMLLMLPVKTLSRFKSVCKSWLSLISSKDFVQTHLCKSSNDPHFTHHHLIVYHIRDQRTFSTRSVYSLLNEPAVTEPVDINYPMQNPDTVTRVIGYSNGLVCLEVTDGYEIYDLFLWNPSTRTSRKLPNMENSFLTYDLFHDFFYDESNNDFKVFAAEEDGSHMYGYSLKYDGWRLMIKDFDFSVKHCGVYANGAVYWASLSEEVQSIVSLDMNTETHREILLPNFGEGAYSWTLTTYDKSLSVLCGFEGAHADLWVMKNCGTKESWTKLFTIPYKDTLPSYKRLEPLCTSVNGQIMLELESHVLLYNSRANTVKVLLNDGAEKLYALTWVESLVSPNI